VYDQHHVFYRNLLKKLFNSKVFNISYVYSTKTQNSFLSFKSHFAAFQLSMTNRCTARFPPWAGLREARASRLWSGSGSRKRTDSGPSPRWSSCTTSRLASTTSSKSNEDKLFTFYIRLKQLMRHR
jgi:hypothetical protein